MFDTLYIITYSFMFWISHMRNHKSTQKKNHPYDNSKAALGIPKAALLCEINLAATYSPTNTLRSTIGAGGLNCRVRHVTGCIPSAMTTRNLFCNTRLLFRFRFKKTPATRNI